MHLTVEKIDDINITIRGTVPHRIIQEKISGLRAQAGDEIAADDKSFQREAEGQILHEFIERGMKEAKVTQDEMLGQPSFKTYEEQEDGLFLEVEISTRPAIDTNVAYMDIVPSYTSPTLAEVIRLLAL